MATATGLRGTKTKPATTGSRTEAEEIHEEALRRQVPAWGPIIWLGVIHLGVLAAPFTFTWQALIAMVVLHWFTGGIGICLGFHRQLTHTSFSTYRPVRWALALIGGLAGEGSAIDWVANHRKHHALSDKPGDPHSPHDGAWWSHVFWLCWTSNAEEHEKHIKRWAPDMLKDPVFDWLGRNFLAVNIVFGLMTSGVGYLIGGTSMAISFLVWAVFVRLAFVLHSTWFVNSASHIWGYRNYQTTDDSRNNWWVALVSYGEGWHNNHHAYPRMAMHGHRWWEIDMTYAAIRLLKLCGLAWDVVDYKHRHDPPC
jgi:stearoyl-CoA desaturase (delta-9 desaturase)